MPAYKMECAHKYPPLTSLPGFWRGIVLLCTFLMTADPPLQAQQRYKVVLEGNEKAAISISGINPRETYDSLFILQKVNEYIRLSRQAGYLYANVDTLIFTHDSCRVQLFKGNKWHRVWKDAAVSNKWTLDRDLTKTFPSDTTDFIRISKKWLEPYLDHGYPFATVSFYSQSNHKDSLELIPLVDPGRYYVYDTLQLTGNLRVSKKFLQLYLDIIPGRPYQHSRILELSKMINDLPFAVTDSLPSIYFYSEKAGVQLFAGHKQASRFDFILGLAPSASGSGFTFNGELTADLVNRFSRGESLGLRFKRLSLEDQFLQLNFTYPYLFGTRFGLDVNFGINRNRSLSVDANGSAGFQFMVSGKKSLKLLWTTKSSRLTDLDTITIKTTGKLPDVLDFNLTGLSLSFTSRVLDYRFNPRKGLEFEVQANAGFRKFIPNVVITELKDENTSFANAYDSLNQVQLQTSLVLNAAFYQPIKSWASLKMQVYAGTLIQKGKEIENEAFRLGGLKFMRGFQELSILTRSFAIATLENRIILDRNSYLSLPFIDVARMKVSTNGISSWKTAMGLGLGLNFSTRAGIFNFTLAAGNNFKGLPSFGTTLVHFGYLNVF